MSSHYAVQLSSACMKTWNGLFKFKFKCVILTDLSELGGQFLSKTVKRSYTFAKVLHSSIKDSYLSAAFSSFPRRKYWFNLFLVTLRTELNSIQFSSSQSWV